MTARATAHTTTPAPDAVPVSVPAPVPAPETVSADTTAEPTDAANPRLVEAHRIVKHNVYWAVGAGLVPFPVADFIAMTAVQVKMLKELSDHYHLRFFDDKAKKLVAALVAGTGSVAVTGLLAASFMKVVPFIGSAIGVVGTPVLAGALTQAIGNIFVVHYESGGTLLDFDVEKMRAHFQRELTSAKQTVPQELKKSSKQPVAP